MEQALPVVRDVCGCADALGEREHEIGCDTIAGVCEIAADEYRVASFAPLASGEDRSRDRLVRDEIEVRRREGLAEALPSIVIEEEGAEDGLFGLEVEAGVGPLL